MSCSKLISENCFDQDSDPSSGGWADLCDLMQAGILEDLRDTLVRTVTSTPFSSFAYALDRDALRAGVLCLLENKQSPTSIVTMQRFPLESFADRMGHATLELVRRRLHGSESRCDPSNQMLRVESFHHGTQPYLQVCMTEIIHATIYAPTKPLFLALNTVAGFWHHPVTKASCPRPLFTASDVATACGFALEAERCLSLDRSLCYLLLHGLKVSLEKVLPTMTNSIADCWLAER